VTVDAETSSLLTKLTAWMGRRKTRGQFPGRAKWGTASGKDKRKFLCGAYVGAPTPPRKSKEKGVKEKNEPFLGRGKRGGYGAENTKDEKLLDGLKTGNSTSLYSEATGKIAALVPLYNR